MNDSQKYRQVHRQRTQRGVSLIEVLVVLVILVTGILTIIRLFPSGFFSIQSAGNAQTGDSLGGAAIQAGAQDAQSLPDSIQPGSNLLPATSAVAAMYSNYDPDDPNNFENARMVFNETISVPTIASGQSVYAVKYGPVVMPADPTGTVAGFPSYFTVNSPYWTALPGNSAPAAVVGTPAPVDVPQDTLLPGQERFMVDLARQEIAVPYAAYTLTSTNPSPTYTSYDQRMIVSILGSDGKTYTQYLDVQPGTTQDTTNPHAPMDNNNPQGFLPDTSGNYQGGWFYPTGKDASGNPAPINYPDGSITNPQQPLPSAITWVSVTLYRPYTGIRTGNAFPFGLDPYQFKLLGGNIVTTASTGANLGVVSFNPMAAKGSGAQARKAQISYIVYGWNILHEDHDVPSLSGTGSTTVVRTAVPNLLRPGSANPDNSINSGVADSNYGIYILDLDSGQIIAPGTDPTLLNDEDLNGTFSMAPYNTINVSYSLGRLTFGSDAFGDNSKSDGSGTAPAHRIRVFYTADLNWTVAVQKAPSYFRRNTTAAPTDTTPLGAGEYAYDPTQSLVYFARCNAGKTVEIDGSYTTTSGAGVVSAPTAFSQTQSVSPVLNDVGASDVTVLLNVPANAAVTFTAVRGLSARAEVAWKERNQWKVHSVDAVLNRMP